MRAVADCKSEYLRISFFPQGHVSKFQKRQMISAAAQSKGTAKAIAFEGRGDDMDIVLKALAADGASARHGVCGVNSMNWGRVLAQTVHVFWTYLRVREGCQAQSSLPAWPQLHLILPTGAMGGCDLSYPEMFTMSNATCNQTHEIS